MIFQQELNKIINNLNLKTDLKNRLMFLVSIFQKNCLKGLYKELCRNDFLLASDSLVEQWEEYARIFSGINKRDNETKEKFFILLEKNIMKFGCDESAFFLYLVIDVKTSLKNNNFFLNDEYEKLLFYESYFLWDLPQEEALVLLKNNLLFLSKENNIFMDFQVLVQKNRWYLDKNFTDVFSNALLSNKEKLGKFESKTIADWINECLTFSVENKSKISTFQVADFLVKNSSVKKLTESEKLVLSDILRLFLWFHEPFIDQDEVILYKQEIITKKLQAFEETERLLIDEAMLSKDRDRLLDNLFFLKTNKAMGSVININQKLQNLKAKAETRNRVSNQK